MCLVRARCQFSDLVGQPKNDRADKLFGWGGLGVFRFQSGLRRKFHLGSGANYGWAVTFDITELGNILTGFRALLGSQTQAVARFSQ